jgi:hypothetical protein
MQSRQRPSAGQEPHGQAREQGDAAAPAARRGHNADFRAAAQWQDRKTDDMRQPHAAEHDLDLVEQEFYRSALSSADPTSMLRLARIPFVADLGDGKLMRLLSIRLSDKIEVGAISPGYGGSDVVYQPLPASLVTHSRDMRFVYHTPDGIRSFTYAEIRDLPNLA